MALGSSAWPRAEGSIPLSLLTFSLRKSVPVIRQAEAAECGLAAICMLINYCGDGRDLRALREQFPLSKKGLNFPGMISVLRQCKMATRAVKVELSELTQLRLPALLHWDFNHFVVLTAVGTDYLVVHDPAIGKRRVTLAAASEHFTGVALEAWPTPQFVESVPQPTIRLRNLIGGLHGLKKVVGQVLVVAVALEVCNLLGPFFLQWTIDQALPAADTDLLLTLVVGFGLLLLAQLSFTAARSWLLIYIGATVALQWRSALFAHLVRLPAVFFERRALGDVVSRFGSSEQIQRTLTTVFIEASIDGALAAVTMLVMLLIHPRLALAVFCSVLAYAMVRWLWYRPLHHATDEQIRNAAKQHSHFLESIRAVKTIKLFGKEDERGAHWLALLAAQMNGEVRLQYMQLAYRSLNGLIFGLEHLAVIGLGAALIIKGELTLGTFLAFNAYRMQFDTRGGNLIDRYFEHRMLHIHAERLADIALSAPEPDAPTASCELPASMAIEIRALDFRYAAAEAPVLKNISFHIADGECVALTGPSGCGKTTLANILTGLLIPSGGSILVGGKDLRTISLSRWRAAVGTVLQDDTLLAGTIAENICFFDPAPDRDWIEQCAELAALRSDILAMPMRFETLVGDMGNSLSGGQYQRLLLARALYKRPRILILDEATSHLDLATESAVSRAVQHLKMTRLLIAHRPATIASADRVIELQRS